MFGKDHLAAQRGAHRAIVGGGRSAKPDHRDPKPGAELDHAPVVLQRCRHQRMTCQDFGGLAVKGGVLVKGGFKEAVDGLGGQLVDDGLGQRFGTGGKAFARPVAPPRQERQRLLRSTLVPTVQPAHDMACIRGRHPGNHHNAPCHQTFQSGHFDAAGQCGRHGHGLGDPRQNRCFAGVQPLRIAAHGHHKATIELACCLG